MRYPVHGRAVPWGGSDPSNLLSAHIGAFGVLIYRDATRTDGICFPRIPFKRPVVEGDQFTVLPESGSVCLGPSTAVVLPGWNDVIAGPLTDLHTLAKKRMAAHGF